MVESAPPRIPTHLRGIVDTLLGVNLIKKSNIPHKNRLAVILLDSAFETACRAYLKYKAKLKLDSSHKNRENLVRTVKSKLTEVDDVVWETIDFVYNDIRNDLYHESSAKTIIDDSLLDYEEAIYFIIDKSLNTDIVAVTSAQSEVLRQDASQDLGTGSKSTIIPLHKLTTDIDRLVAIIDVLHPKELESEINDYLKREGISKRYKQNELGGILSRNRGTNKYFFYDKATHRWQLSGLGKFKLGQIMEVLGNDN